MTGKSKKFEITCPYCGELLQIVIDDSNTITVSCNKDNNFAEIKPTSIQLQELGIELAAAAKAKV